MEYSKKKPRVASINLGFTGSTGTIMGKLQDLAIAHGVECTIAAPGPCPETMKGRKVYVIGRPLFRKASAYASVLTGLDGCFSIFSTLRYIQNLKKFGPDILHLHNLHYSYVNLPLLFRYIKKSGVAVVWTLHDCWSFTGHCPHFMYEKCDKWASGCHNCPRYREYPKAIFDNSRLMWRKKKKWFTGIQNMTLVAPSKWLAERVSQSFLKDNSVRVIYNGIDLEQFKPTPSDFVSRHGIENKKIVLGVSFGWSNKKGLDVFLQLAKRLPQDYQIVLVGTDSTIDQMLPENIISIHRTQNQRELAEIYSAAQVFVNPTREDNYPTVNMEAIACGTPAVTFRTGGSPECVDDRSGSVVTCDDVDAMEREIIRVCTQQPFLREECVAAAQRFDADDRFREYIQLYHEMVAIDPK